MSYQSDQEQQDGADGSDPNADGIDDLTMALHGGGEANFVSESKQPMSKGTMVVGGLLVACGAITYFMYVRNGPAEAIADPNAAKVDQIVTGFLADPNRTKKMDDLIKNTEAVVRQFKQEIPQVPLAQLANNPFEKNKPKPTADQALVEAERKKQLAAARAKEAIADLKLQTIIHPNPKRATCMINNRLYRKGQQISVGSDEKTTFTVEDIRPDGVTVSAPFGEEKLKFELKMKQ